MFIADSTNIPPRLCEHCHSLIDSTLYEADWDFT